MARRGYKSNEDAAEFFKKMQEVADGKRTATSGNTQQQQLASKEALTAKPVVTPAVPTYQAPVAQPMGVQGIIGQANVPAAMAATGAAAGARMAAQPMANAILRPGDPAWKRNLALGGMDNLSQEQLLMAREQANMDARSGRNPYNNLPQAPDTGKTVWWNAKKGQGTGKTTANYVIGRADKAIERGDYKSAMQAIEYGINAEMSADDRQKLTDYIKAESFGGTAMRDRETAGTAQQVADAWQTIGKTNTANWETWKAQNLNDDVMRYLAEDYGIEKYKDADDLAKKLTKQIRTDDDRRAWQQQLTGMREGYMTQNASAAFAQRGREEVARAQQDGAAVKTVQRYMQAQQAVTVLDWLADKLAIGKPGRPADVDSQEVQLAVRALRAMGVNVPELNDQNYYDVVSGLREQEQTAVSQNWDVLEQRGYDVDLMAAYTARTTSKAFEQGLRALPKREMGVVDKVLASIASVPFSVYIDPFVGVANALQVAGDGDVEDTGSYIPTVDTYDQPGRELRGQVAEGIGSKGWQFGYNALMSTADSVVGAATMGEGYTVAMGLSSMGAEIQNAIDHGVSGRRALVYGAAKGAIEILTEYVSTEKLVDMLRSTKAKTLIGRLGEIATQGATEGSEEMASDILGGVADAVILRGTSDHNRQVRELMSKGYSAVEAEAEVMTDEASSMMESGLSGFLSGIMGAGFAEGVNAAKGTKLAAEQIAALSQSEKAEDRLLYREICELAGVEYSMSDNKKMEVLEAYLREQRDNAKAAERQRKATERAVEETADEMIRNAAPEVPGLAMNELTMDTVEEDTETILQAVENAQTSQEAASAVKLAQDELAWISNAAALGRIEKDVADDLANRLEDMIQSERTRIGTEEREQAQQEQEIQNFFREEETDEETDEDVLPDAVTGTDYLQEEENDEGPESIGDSQQREADLDPGRQTGRMDEGGREEEEKSAIRKRAERAAEIRDGIRTGEIVPQSGQEVGISFAAEDKTIWVLPDEITDRYEDLKGIKEDAEASGYELTLVAGDIRINRGGNLFHADAVIETDENGGKRIILRADTRITDPVKNYNHEMWHAMVAGNRAVQADILSQMREQYTDAEIYKMVYDYGDAFNWVYGRFTENMTEEEANALAERYLEETLADAYGEIQRAKADNAIARDMVSRNAERIAQERATQAAGMQSQLQEMDKITQGEDHEAGVIEDDSGQGIAAYNDNGQSAYSLSTWYDSGRDILERYLNNQTKGKKASLTKEEAKEMMAQMDALAEICETFRDKNAVFGAWSDAEIVERDGKPVFSVVKANGDYKMNLDFSLVCKKRRTLDAVFNEMIRQGLMDEIGNVGQVTISHINDIIRNHKFETACALCFVDAKRYRQGMVADTFCALWNNLVRSMAPEGTTIDFFNYGGNQSLRPAENALDKLGNGTVNMDEIDRTMQVYGAKTVNYKVAKFLKEHPEQRKLLLRGDFMSTAGFDAVKADNPELMKLYNAKKGTGGPKAAESDVQYLSEIVSGRSWTANKAYAVGGVRIQSFSDYVPRLVFDYIQMVGDLAAKKMPAHAYTKETMFALQFGLTGIKINLSLVPDVVEDGVAPGLDKDGNYIWRDGQSFGSTDPDGGAMEGFELAKKIQNTPGYGKNCGTIAVGVSDEQILKMLDDPDIRMIIPYHKSSLNHLIASLNNIDKFTDYTKVQTTKVRETGNGLPKGTKDFNFNEAMRKNGGDPKAAADEYLQWCEKKGFVPKFEQFSGHENYYKLLEDFSCFDEAGNKAPQGGVEIRFPGKGDAFGSMEQLIRQGLDEDAVLQGKQDSEVPKIVAEIRNEMNNGTLEAMEAEASGVLDDAKEMEAAGESMDDIAAATGWRKNESGMWQQSFAASEEDQYEADRAAYMDALMADNLEQLMRQEQEERNLRKAEEQQRVEEARASRERNAMRNRAKVLQGDAEVLDAQRQAERAAGGETGNAAELVEADRRARQESIARRAAEMERQNERNREAIGKVDRSGMTPEEAARSRKIENAQKRTIKQLKQDIVQLERDIEAQRRVAEVMRASNEGENPDAAILERREESARAAEAKERALRETLRITEDALARKQRDKTEAKFDRDLQQIEKQAKDWTKKHLESQIKKAEKRLVALEQAERAMREAGADVASTVAAKEKTAAELRVMREAMRDTTRDQRDKAKREEKKRRTAEKKKTAAQQAKTDFINDVLNTFQIGIKWRGAAAEALAKMADQLASTGTVSEQERNLMLKALIRRGEQWLHASNEAHAAWDSYHGSRFYVPAEVRAEFGESWDAFQASAWKVGVELTDNETDQSVRDWEREFYRDGRRAASDREALEDMIDLVREGFGQKLTLAEIMGRNQQQYGMSVRDQVSQMRSALDRMLNVFAEKAQLEYRVRSEYEGIEEWANKQVQAEHDRTTKRLRIADQKLAQRDHWIAEHLNEELKKKQERAARQTLFDDVKRLEKLARKQDPKTQEAVRKLIGKLDTVARWVSPKGLENLQAMAAMYHEQQAKEGSNWEPDPYIEARIARLNQVQIDSLPIEDVRTLVQDVMALTHAIQTRNKMLSDLKFEQREKMALEIKKEIWGTKGTKVRNKAEKFLKGVLMEELLRPKTFLNMISGYHDNGAMASMIRALENGQTKQLDYAMKAEQIFDEFTRNAENREWLQKASSDKAEWQEVLGVRMAPMMKIALYMNSLNFQNRYHIIHGGVKIPGEQAYRAGMKEEAEARGRIVRFTPAQLKSLKSTMSAQELAYARMLTKYFDGYSAKEINETSMELYGFERATTTNYYPITVVSEFKNDPDKVAMQTVNNGSIEGNRHLQERKSKSATPIKLISANQTLLQHVDEMSKFCGMAIPLRDFSAILSFAFPDFGSSVTETIGQRWGEDGKAYVEKLIKDIQGDGGDKNRFDKIMANIRGKMAGATLSFNPGVTLSQFASLPGAAATLGVMPLVQGMKLWERVDTKLIEAYTPLLWYRSGGAEEELQQLSKKKGIMEKTGWWLGGNWISKMDKFTVGRIWKACEYKVMTELGMQPGDAETVASGNDVFYRNVAELFNRTVYDTQPNYTTLQRTQIGRTKSEAVKMLNMYKTVPYQYYNMMFEAGGRLRAAKGTKKWNEAVRFAARSFGGVLVANMTYVLMKQVIKGLLTGKWPDDEEGMTMEAFGLDLLDTYAGSVMGMSELVATIEEFTGVKQAGYINSDSNIVIGLYDEIKDEIQKLADADDWTDVLLQGKSLAKSMSKLLGVPAGNFEKYIVGSVRQVFPEAGAYYDNFFKEIEAKQLKQKTGEEFRAALEVLMDNRTDGVADETIDEIQRLWEAGYDTIPKAIPSSLKDENDDEIKLTWGTKKAYRQIWNEAVTGTIDDLIRTELYQAADDETKAIMINNLYTYAAYGGKLLVNTDYAPNSSEKWIDGAIAAREGGIELADYIAWRVINAGLDGKDENGESVTGLKDQRQRELLEQTNWTNAQKAAVYSGQVSEGKAEKLEEMYNAGLDYQQANAVANAGSTMESVMTALEMDGLNAGQRWKAAMTYASASMAKQLEAGQEFGVEPEKAAEVMRNADANGNGKVNQQEAEDYISGMSIGIQQKAYLWQLVTDGKNGTKNPFGQTFGAEFYEWAHRNDE